MSTEYTQRVTIAAPELLTSLANELALCLGESRADDQTFIGANYQDVDGNLYSVASTVAKSVFAQIAGQPLQAPDHAPDMDFGSRHTITGSATDQRRHSHTGRYRGDTG